MDVVTAGAPLRTQATTSSLRRDRHYAWMTLAIATMVFVGFAFTYFGPVLNGTYQEVSPTVHVHGWTFFAWYLLLPLQSGLIHTRRVRLHRTLGALSLGLAAVMVATGLVVIGARMADAAASPTPTFWSMFGPVIFSTLVLFAGFYAAAFLLRRRSAFHKRLMIVAGAAGAGAASFRVLMVVVGPAPWVPPASILATNLFIVAGMVHDRLREGRIHPAYRLGLVLCLAVEGGILLLTPTPAGQLLARALAWVGQVSASLY
jgi:hypothetical protein